MRLIDAGALVEFLQKEIIECEEEYDEYSEHTILGAGQEAELIRDKVKEMPTVDIVECKDCRYSVDNDYCLFSTADMGEINKMDADDFCSRGERRDEIN